MKERIWDYVLGALLIIFGLAFIIYSEEVFGSIVLIAGIVIIAFSSLKLVLVLKSSLMPSFFVFSSIVGIIFGILLISNAEQSIKIVTILIGIWFLIGGISSLLLLLKQNANKKELYKPIFKIIVGATAFIAPIIFTHAIGYVVGIILILAGIATFINSDEDEKVYYKVKVKK